MKQKSTFNSKIGIISVLLLLVVYILNITAVLSQIIIQVTIYWILAAMAMFAILINGKVKKHILALLLFALYIVIITVLSQNMNFSVFFINFGYMTLWIWVIILFNFANEKKDFNENLFKLIAWFAILIGMYIIINYGVRSEMLDFGFVNNSHYLLCTIPILLLVKARRLRISALIIACLTVLLSLKRTSILALIIMGIFLAIYYSKGKSKGFKIRGIIIVLLLLFLFTQSDFLANWLGVDVLSRFRLLSQDEGSGRKELYIKSLKTVSEGGVFRFLFGCGYNGFKNFHGSLTSSHSDFLELLIDYGVFGLVFYLGIIWRYIKACVCCIKYRTPYAESCIASLCAFFCISLFGHCVIYPSYFMMLLIFWSYIENKLKTIMPLKGFY